MKFGILIALLVLLSGCSSMLPEPGDGPGRVIQDPMAIPDAVPEDVPYSRYGNPKQYEVFGKTYQTWESGANHRERGIASWYGSKFHGRRTSSGEPYDMYTMTAAHKHLPLPTWVEVRRLDNDRRIVVKVNDRGPFAEDRIIDLSYAAAAKLGMLGTGTAPVEIRTVTHTTTAAAAPTTVASAGAGYWIQLAAFQQAQNAQQLLTQLNAAGLPSIGQINRGNDGLHRVRLGPLADAQAVAQLNEQLRQANLGPGQIIRPSSSALTQ